MKLVRFVLLLSLMILGAIDSLSAQPKIVDLGLSVKWASCNLGASSPTDFGDYYAWAEISTKTSYVFETLKYCENASGTVFSKYNTVSKYGRVDNKTVLEPSDDVAYQKLGGKWRMPTKAEWMELREKCTWELTTVNKFDEVYKVTSKVNGETIFIPLCGFIDNPRAHVGMIGGFYWTSSLDSDDPQNAFCMSIPAESSYINPENIIRSAGMSIRAVYDDVDYFAGVDDGHEWADLGLSVKWATCNVGASKPNETGSYFAWGETRPKALYNESNLKYCLDDFGHGYSKYVLDEDYGIPDGLDNLELSDDAANVNWGGHWRTPTKEELKELYEKCTWTWTTMSGIKGYNVTSKVNGKSIFLPAAGRKIGSPNDDNDIGKIGYFASSSLRHSSVLYALFFSSDYISVSGDSTPRSLGYPVRPVYDKDLKKTAIIKEEKREETGPSSGEKNGHDWVDLGLSVKWATCNIGASSPSERGSLFAWGETSSKKRFSLKNYKFIVSITKDRTLSGPGDTYSKYVSELDSGVKDHRDKLELLDDAAFINWGEGWRIPKKAELDELKSKCTWKKISVNGVDGYQITSKVNGNSIFLPIYHIPELGTENNGCYWSSLLGGRGKAWGLSFYRDVSSVSSREVYRYLGIAIRPVYSE